jgi:tetratricopeptide (TPR) repeat protein
MTEADKTPDAKDLSGALEIAGRFEDRGRYAEALAVADIALADQPAHPDALLLSARCLLGLGRAAEAAQRFGRAAAGARTALDRAKLLCKQGEALREAGDDRAALDAFAKATLADAELPAGWFGHGLSALRLGEYKDAERSLAESRRLRPDGETAMLLGLARLRLGKAKDAEADLREAVRLRPELKARIDKAARGEFEA